MPAPANMLDTPQPVLMRGGQRSAQLLGRAKQSLAGGDSSTMRVLPYHLPLVAERGEGCRLWDADGTEFLDMNMAYGPLLLGHRAPQVVESVTQQIRDRGSMLGFPTEITARVAEKVKQLYPSIELLRFANSGTEACATAVRLARTVTGRRKLILFEGNYHGWSEAVFHKYHAPPEELPSKGYGPAIPGTTGMGQMDAIVVRWNDLDAFNQAMREHGPDVAAVMLEPVMGNAGLLPPREDFLPALREATQGNGSMLIFDEVITGCRAARGGAQELYGVYPDITVVSKAIGGGYPISAFGASAELMDVIVNGPLFHGGVFSGNATVMASAEAVLDTLIANGEEIYSHLNAVTDRLCRGLEEIFSRLGVPAHTQHVGAAASLFLTDEPVERLYEYRDVRRHGRFDRFIELQHAAQQRGVYFHPNMFEPMFPSFAHKTEDIDEALDRIEDAARAVLV